jgi:hypothetical protein
MEKKLNYKVVDLVERSRRKLTVSYRVYLHPNPYKKEPMAVCPYSHGHDGRYGPGAFAMI